MLFITFLAEWFQSTGAKIGRQLMRIIAHNTWYAAFLTLLVFRVALQPFGNLSNFKCLVLFSSLNFNFL